MTPDDLHRLLSSARIERQYRQTGNVPQYPSGVVRPPGYYNYHDALRVVFYPRKPTQPPRADRSP